MPQAVWHIAASFLLAVALAGLITRFVFQLVRVKGGSMEHTLKNGDLLFCVRPGTYRRGEVVICRYPRRVTGTLEINAAFSLTWHTLFVKRLVALPGASRNTGRGQPCISSPDRPGITLLFFYGTNSENAVRYVFGLLFFRMTSWLPPSTIDVEETTVSLAFSWSSGIESAPQLHIVERTLYNVVVTPSASEPA